MTRAPGPRYGDSPSCATATRRCRDCATAAAAETVRGARRRIRPGITDAALSAFQKPGPVPEDRVMWDAGDHLWRQGDRSGGSGSAARGQGHGRGTPPPAAASGATTCEVVHLGLITWLFGRRLNLPPAVTR